MVVEGKSSGRREANFAVWTALSARIICVVACWRAGEHPASTSQEYHKVEMSCQYYFFPPILQASRFSAGKKSTVFQLQERKSRRGALDDLMVDLRPLPRLRTCLVYAETFSQRRGARSQSLDIAVFNHSCRKESGRLAANSTISSLLPHGLCLLPMQVGCDHASLSS